MTVANQDVRIVTGEAVQIVAPVTRQADGTEVDLDGASCVYRAVLFESGDALIEKAATIDVANSQVSVILEGEDTAALAGSFYHEFRVTDVAGRPFVVTRGTLIAQVAPLGFGI